MESQPKLTVGIALYNNESRLSETLDSILNQSFTDFKIIISDDCSTDTSYLIANEYAKKDKRITVVRQNANLGPIDNWYELSRNITTPYFLWLTAEDILLPDYFEKAIIMHESNPNAVLVYPKSLLINVKGEISTVSADSNLDTSNLNIKDRLIKLSSTIVACTAVYGIYKTNFIKHLPLQARVIGHDILWLFTAAIYGDILELPQVLFYRRNRERKETFEEATIRYIRWGIFTPTRYSPFARFAIRHFKEIFKAENISFKTKLALVYELSIIFGNKYNLRKKDILYQFVDDLITYPFRQKKNPKNIL